METKTLEKRLEERLDSEQMESVLFDCILERAPCWLDIKKVRDREGRSLLHWTVSLNLREETEYLLLQGIDPNVTDDEGYTPLHLANSYDVAEILLRYGANPNIRDRYDRTPLHYVGSEVTELLIRHGADVNAKDTKGNTPLHYARSKEKVRILLRYGADPDAKNEKGLPPIFSVVRHDCDAALMLYNVTSKDILSLKDKDETLLHLAVRSGCRELVERLEYIDAQNADGHTPLHIAVLYNRIELAKILIEKGADPLKKDKNGATPLMWMASAIILKEHPYTDVIQLVLERFDVKNDILRYAFNAEQRKLLKLLFPDLQI
jgi:ankyrin repeat protein